VISLALVLTLPTVVSAGASRPWLAVSGGWGTYSMSDVNSEIRAVNDTLAGSGLTMDEISGGFGFGLTVGVDLPSRVSVGFGYERLSASTDVGDFSGSVTYKLPANAFRATVGYRFPTERTVAASVGFGLGLVKEAGSLELVVTGAGAASADLSGSGPLLETFVGGDWWAAPQFALVGSAGYRYAKVREIRVQGMTAYNADGSKYTVDYSGIVMRLGFKVALSR
jgi:hypothetical protein